MRRDVPALFTRARDQITKEAVDPSLEMLESVSGSGGETERLLVQAGRFQGLMKARQILETLLNEADRDQDENR